MILQSRWKSRINPKSAFLQEFRKDVMTQRGEDGIIEKIFEIVGATNRYCVEFGAWDGKLYSSTWNMLNNRDWHGLLIEANEAKFAELESAYRDNDQVAILNTLVEREGEAFLDAILTRAEAPADLSPKADLARAYLRAGQTLRALTYARACGGDLHEEAATALGARLGLELLSLSPSETWRSSGSEDSQRALVPAGAFLDDGPRATTSSLEPGGERSPLARVELPAFLTSDNLGGAAFPTGFMAPGFAVMNQTGSSPGTSNIDWIRCYQLANS